MTAEATALAESGMMRIPEVQKHLGVSRSFLYAEMDAGRLTWAKFGRSRRIPRAVVMQYAVDSLRGPVTTVKE